MGFQGQTSLLGLVASDEEEKSFITLTPGLRERRPVQRQEAGERPGKRLLLRVPARVQRTQVTISSANRAKSNVLEIYEWSIFKVFHYKVGYWK
jgi:hypothetical protein